MVELGDGFGDAPLADGRAGGTEVGVDCLVDPIGAFEMVGQGAGVDGDAGRIEVGQHVGNGVVAPATKSGRAAFRTRHRGGTDAGNGTSAARCRWPR